MNLLSASLLIALSVPLSADMAVSSDEKAVLATEKQFADAMVHSNPAVVAKLLAEDVSYLHSSGLGETKAEIVKSITGKFKYTAINFETTKVRQYGNTVITSHNATFVTSTGPHHAYLTTVWVKNASGWQMVERQGTELK